jgi:hypothetical protein
MAIYYPLGEAIVPLDELLENSQAVSQFKKGIERGEDVHIDFTSGRVSRHSLGAALPTPAQAGAVPFEPVGMHRPLMITIRHIYTGSDSPDGKAMVVTSAVKGLGTYDGAPRAVNQLTRKVNKGSHFSGIPATDQGTYLVFYSPAIVETQASITFEIGFDKFNEDVFETIGGAFSRAAAIPVFLPYSGLLVGAGLAIRLAGKIGDYLVHDGPYFSETESLDIEVAGVLKLQAGLVLITRGNFSLQDRQRYHYEPGQGLVDDRNQPYSGQQPYIVFGIDGRARDELKTFTPTAASAAILERFYKAREGAEVPTDLMIQALTLYSDLKLRNEADHLAEQLKVVPAGSKPQDERRLKALIEGIVTPELRPKQ